MDSLPKRILGMVKVLHEYGYKNIYIYPGMSPSGMNWRFSIGRMKAGIWPQQDHLVYGSVKNEGEVEWSEDCSSSEILARNFVNYYGLSDDDKKSYANCYLNWYSELLKMLEDHELLVFYADYDAPHSYLLKFAPGYRGKYS
ncbi:hypothetical protein ACNKU7_07085 [Microbulbifer sp. SA54]|uniref:hypothetical protein n=1 Tax=Microbulbifer sp. SA54 TaxID=3401577 RepID=UPI003AAE19A8